MVLAKSRVLFICTQNSSRSQMAEGLLNALFGERYMGYSAGTKPYRVNPLAIKAMRDIGIDISNHRSKSVDEFAGEEFDYVITVCDSAREECPYFPGGKKVIHHSFTDPAAVEGTDEEKLAVFCQVRDEIKTWLEEFTAQKSF